MRIVALVRNSSLQLPPQISICVPDILALSKSRQSFGKSASQDVQAARGTVACASSGMPRGTGYGMCSSDKQYSALATIPACSPAIMLELTFIIQNEYCLPPQTKQATVAPFEYRLTPSPASSTVPTKSQPSTAPFPNATLSSD